jgi:3-deoxy-D-manno-octulosonic-acid transferase
MGPSTFNFAEAASAAVAAGAMIGVNDAEQLVLTAKELLDNAGRRAAMSVCALEFAAAHRGATEKTVNLISDLIE